MRCPRALPAIVRLFLTAILVMAPPVAVARGQIPPPDSGIVVAVEFSVDSKVTATPGTEFNLTGNITYHNPAGAELHILLEVSAGTWWAEILPDNVTVTDEGGTVPFWAHVVVPEIANASERIRVNGRWTTDDQEGDVVPDSVMSVVLPAGNEHDSGPNDMILMAAVVGATVSGAVAAGFATRAALRRLPPLVPPFYTRLRRRDIVGHRARHEILRTLERNPGLSLGSLIENVGDSRSTVMYHLRVLEKEGLVRSTREGRARRYFPESMPVRPTIDLEEAIIETIARNPGVDITHVANELGTSKQLVSYHVQKLSRSSRLWAERDGRRKRLFPRETQPPSP